MTTRVAVMLGEDDQPIRHEGTLFAVPVQDPNVVQLVKTAHVSGNQIDVFHCCFCGSGGVFSRSDGSIECDFCHAAFTVTVSPQYAAFPMSVGGQPYPWPGRPADGMDPSMGGDPAMMGDPNYGGSLIPGGGGAGDGDMGADPGDEGSDDDAPPWADGGDESSDSSSDGGPPKGKGKDTKAEIGGKKKPPFGKKSYLTRTGARVDEDDMMRHLAIVTASDPDRMAQLVKQERS